MKLPPLRDLSCQPRRPSPSPRNLYLPSRRQCAYLGRLTALCGHRPVRSLPPAAAPTGAAAPPAARLRRLQTGASSGPRSTTISSPRALKVMWAGCRASLRSASERPKSPQGAACRATAATWGRRGQPYAAPSCKLWSIPVGHLRHLPLPHPAQHPSRATARPPSPGRRLGGPEPMPHPAKAHVKKHLCHP